jgi:hypothetical protein
MTEFRTIVRTASSPSKIALNHRVLTIGSCFSEAIGNKMAAHKINTLINPFGVVYNPVSIHKLLTQAALPQLLLSEHSLQYNDRFLNYDLHSSFRGITEADLREKAEAAFATTRELIQNCDWVMITYGTAWVYTLKSSGEIVANCHKQPSRLFEKSLLTVQQIIQSFNELYSLLKSINPGLKFILTISPVRHIKDTLELNAVSKSILRVATHYSVEKYADVEYFPAYEIMLDDLRDYRFYKSDMLHPTEVAEEYIWNAFIEKYMDEQVVIFMQQWKPIKDAMKHRPFNPTSSGHQIFLKQTLHKLEALKHLINVDQEIEFIRQQLLEGSNSKNKS